jgi:hypothetical protein
LGFDLQAIANGIQFLLLDTESSLEFSEFGSMFLNFIGVVGDPSRSFGMRMFALLLACAITEIYRLGSLLQFLLFLQLVFLLLLQLDILTVKFSEFLRNITVRLFQSLRLDKLERRNT